MIDGFSHQEKYQEENQNSFNFELRNSIQNHIEVMTKISSDNFINSQINKLCDEVKKFLRKRKDNFCR